MPTILEPIGAGLIVALISKFIINNDKVCQPVCTDKQTEPEIIEDDSSSATTSVNGVEVHMHHFQPLDAHLNFLDMIL
jgi:hypothetical protein